MKKIYALIAVAIMFTFGACEVPEDEPGTAADRADTSGAASEKAKPKDKPAKSEKAKPEAPKETAGEANARESAAQYLDMTAYSRSGLIDQLKYEGYSVKDATYGVDAQHADWKEQAALSAAQYLDMTSYSRSGLIDQLKYEGYTQEQAEYGVGKVGL